MHGVAASFADLVVGAQDPVHARHRRQVDALVEEFVEDGRGCLVDEVRAVEQCPDRVAFRGRQGPRLDLRPARRSWWWRALPVAAVVGGLGPTGGPACGPDPDQRLEFADGLVDHGVGSLPLLMLSVARCPNNAESFPWTSLPPPGGVEIGFQPGDPGPQPSVLPIRRVRRRPARRLREGLECALISLQAPGGDQRGVDPFPSQQCTLAGLVQSFVLGQDPGLLAGSPGSGPGFRRHFGIRHSFDQTHDDGTPYSPSQVNVPAAQPASQEPDTEGRLT